ncbi:MAG: HAD hydrolase-like protein [Bacteroidota bacterium]
MSDPIFVFDKDGVIVDTEAIKVRIYEEMIAREYPDKVEAVHAYAFDTIGKPRLEKFIHIFQHIIGLNQKDAYKKAQAYVDESLELYKPVLAEAKLVPGIKDFLQNTPHLKFVCSAAHKSEVDAHLYGNNLTPFLQDWYSTTNKAEILLMLKRKFDTQVVFWGDTMPDYEAAKKADVPFIGVVLPGLERAFEKMGVPVIQDFRKKKKILKLLDKLTF